MDDEWLVEAEARPTINTQACFWLDEDLRIVSQHSHTITTPFMPNTWARTSQKLARVFEPTPNLRAYLWGNNV